MRTAHARLADMDKGFCIPLTLLMNFSLFQYLLTTFFRRRHERRIRLLLAIAFASFASLVPFALPAGGEGDDSLEHARNLNDISEVCSMLTFLLQITIVTRDISRRIKIKSVMRLMWCGELLVAVSLLVLVTNVVDLFAPVIDMDLVELLDSIVIHISLVFVVGFRFHFLGMALGATKVWQKQKAEVVVYALFLTHEVPFVVLEHATALDWHHVKGFWMRVTITLCLSLTIRQRMSSKSSKKGISTMGLGGDKGGPGPLKSQLDHGSTHVAVEEPALKQNKARPAKLTGVVAPSPSSLAVH